jgi:4-amino-4-deoxy-L-arabinose transferase-like glycosyltransferase
MTPESMYRLIDPFRTAIARLVDGLADPARRERAIAWLLLAYGVAWFVYGAIAKSSQDIHADTAEMIVWMGEPALGFPKHPPFPAWLLWLWFQVFPLQDWAFYLFAALNMSAGIYFAWRLAGEWLGGEKLAAVPFLLAAIPFYNFLAFKYDANAALIPLWPLAMWAMMRTIATRHAGWAALAGLAAAAAVLTKYWSVFLLAALALAALVDRRRADYLRSNAPFVTAGVFTAAVAPHAIWLVWEDFPPLTWVGTRRLANSVSDLLLSFGGFIAGTVGYASVALLLVLVFTRPSRAAIADSWFPRDDRRGATIMFWTPFVLPFIPAAARGISLLALWSMPALALLPVMTLGSPLVTVTREAVTRLAMVMCAITVLVAAISPIVAFAILRTGVENEAVYARLAMQAAEREWRQVTDKPLKLVAGPFVLIATAAIYGTDRPSAFSDFSRYLSPGVDDARIAREGLAIMSAIDSPYYPMTERYLASAAVARRAEVTLTRSWLGFQSAPRRFVIAIVPPK